MISAYLSWPSAPLTDRLIRKALDSISTPVNFITKDDLKNRPLLQWATYDDIDHELAHSEREHALSSSYVFRKALIRKHYLSRIIHIHVTKNPDSVLTKAWPQTAEIELSFADELDEMWTDELWKLGDALEARQSWWILKPGMADRGMGIRIFNSKDALQQIFESFEQEDTDPEEENEDDVNENAGADDHRDTAVVTSQLRHFVIQEYLADPLLVDPTERTTPRNVADLTGRKFHLRVYCVASGGITLYVYDRILALFSAVSYAPPEIKDDDNPTDIDLGPHLTNTCLQVEDTGESNVRLLDELENHTILSGSSDQTLTKEMISEIISQISTVMVETFKAATHNPIHFQPMPNAFELFGVDFLVRHDPDNIEQPLQAKLLEINAEPAIEMTGPRLTWILEDLFQSMAKVCVEPFFQGTGAAPPEKWTVGEKRHNLIKCLEEDVQKF